MTRAGAPIDPAITGSYWDTRMGYANAADSNPGNDILDGGDGDDNLFGQVCVCVRNCSKCSQGTTPRVRSPAPHT